MVSSIQIGNFFSTGGKTVLGGTGGSGLDTQSLINALIDARKIGVTRLEDKIAVNDKKSSALGQLKSLLDSFKSASDLLRNVPGFGKASSNAFDYATATVGSNTTVAGSTYLSVTVEPGVRLQSYTINSITSLAAAKKQATDVFTIATADTAITSAAPPAGEFKSGTFTLKGVDITLEDGDSLNSIVSKLNAVADQTGISATVLKVASGEYKLAFSATTTGLAADFDFNSALTLDDPDGVFTNVLAMPGGISTTQDASNAVFEIDGVEIERETNNINDVINGITFNLRQNTLSAPATELTIDIKPDTTVAKNAIIGFINAYNEIRIFAANQSRLKPDGTYTDDAVLANNPTLRSITSGLSSEVTSLISGLSGNVFKSLSDIGITFIDLPETDEQAYVRNALTVDETKLQASLDSKFDEIRNVFEFRFSSDNANVAAFTRSNNITINAFELVADPGGTGFVANYLDANNDPQSVALTATALAGGSGYTLVGPAGTVLDGLTLLYSATTPSTSNVSFSQGVADRLYNYIDTTTKAETGILTVDTESIKTTSEKIQADIDRMNDQIEVYRQQLLDKFSKLEQAIAQTNTLLQSLQADADARANNR